ncbi:26195_t:CDS:2, partial [Dentiscutata erythropus]
ETIIPGTPPKYKELYTECRKHDKNSRPNISQVEEILSGIIISDEIVPLPQSQPHSISYEIVAPPQSQPQNISDEMISVKLENINVQNEELEVEPDRPFTADDSVEI